MDPKGYEKKPWFPYLKNMYEEIGENMMAVDAKGYEEKPWWPYVLDLQEKIESGGGGGSSDFSTAEVTITSDTDSLSKVLFCSAMEDPTIPMKALVPMNNYQRNMNVTIALYGGLGIMTFAPTVSDPNNFTISTTGDCEYNAEGGGIFVTGDGTIAITYIG